MTEHEDKVAALGSNDRATHDWLMTQSKAHRELKNYDGADLARERANEIVYPERRVQREGAQKIQSDLAQRNLQPKQFFHGTNVDLRKGDEIKPASALGRGANWATKDSTAHAHAAPSMTTAGIYARDVSSMHGGHERVYQVEPTGEYEDDPHEDNGVRSTSPFRVVKRVPKTQWDKWGA